MSSKPNARERASATRSRAPLDPFASATPDLDPVPLLFSAVNQDVADGWTLDRLEHGDSGPSAVLSRPVGVDPDTVHVALCVLTLGAWFLPWMAWRVARPAARRIEVRTVRVESGEVVREAGLTPAA